jgi:hypothetical protein
VTYISDPLEHGSDTSARESRQRVCEEWRAQGRATRCWETHVEGEAPRTLYVVSERPPLAGEA